MTPEEIARLYQTPRSIEIDTIERYVTCRQYDGRGTDWFDTGSDTPVLERKPCINYPVARTAIGSHVSFVLGEGRWPNLTCATSEDDSDIDEEWGLGEDESDVLDRFVNVVLLRYVGLKKVAREMLSDAMGARSVGVVISVVRGRLRAETVKASWCEPELDNLGEVSKLEISYPYIETFYNDFSRKWEKRCMLYRRVIDAKSDTVYKPAPGKENGERPTWSVDKDKTREHGLGFCPVVWYPFQRPCSTANTFDGVALHEHQRSEIDCLNFTLSQKQRTALVAGDPQMYETGVEEGSSPAPLGVTSRGIVDTTAAGPDGKPVGVFASATSPGARAMRRMMARKKGPGVVWQYQDPQSKVGYLTLEGGALKAVDEHARDLRNKIAESMSAIFIDPAEMHTHAAMSGKALALIFARQTAFDDLVRDNYADNGLIPLVSMLLRVVLVVGRDKPRALYLPGVAKVVPVLEGFERDTEEGDKVWMPPRLEPVWGPYFAPAEQEQLFVVQLVVAALAGGVITTEMAIEKLDQAGVFEVGSAKEIVDAILAEKTQSMALAHQAMSGLASGGDGTGGASTTPPGVPSDKHPTGAPTPSGGGGAVPGASQAGAIAASAGSAASRVSEANAAGSAGGPRNLATAEKPGMAPKPGAAGEAVTPRMARDGISQRGDSTAGVTESVYQQLAEDFPPDAIAWVRATHWEGPVQVPIDQIDFSSEEEWRATQEPEKLASFKDKIEKGQRKPLVLVNEPNNERLIIVDGHHRALAYKSLGEPVVAYVGHVAAVSGPWDVMHASQRKGGGGPKPSGPKSEKVSPGAPGGAPAEGQ